MVNFRSRKWIPGLLFLTAQIANTVYELTQDTRTLSWAPHTTQVRYHISAFEDGLAWDRHRIEARYGVAQNSWEAHAVGNLVRIIRSAEKHQNQHPDSVRVVYSKNGNPERTFRWEASLK